MKKIIISISAIFLLSSCYELNRLNFMNNDYYEILVSKGNYIVMLPVCMNDSSCQIISLFDDMMDYLCEERENYLINRNKIFDAVKYNKCIEVNDTIEHYWIGKVIPHNNVDSIYKKGFNHFKDYYAGEIRFNYEKLQTSNPKEIAYIISKFIEHKYFVSVASDSGEIHISEYPEFR